MYSPKGTAAGAKLPVHIQIHGGGFIGGAAEMQCGDDCQAIVSNGMHYMSVGYRLVATKYYYGADSQEEEFIHAAANGTLTLDTTGARLSASSLLCWQQKSEFDLWPSF